MPREEIPVDQPTFDRVLAEELAKGTDRRVAEGRAKSAGARAYRKEHGEPAPKPRATAPAAAAAASGNGGGDGDGQGAAVAAAAAVPAGATATALRTAPAPTGKPPAPKAGAADKHRLLALVAPEGVQKVQREQGDRVNVFPHLLIEEMVAMFIVLVALTVFSTFVDAPLRELANPNLTPNPSKAPWYFLGLQELLRYFHPMIAGVIIPTLILVGLAVIPYVDRNPSTKPGDRRLAIMLFTMLFMFGATLTIIGCFFRGPGFNWVWPWNQGLFFEL
ncbi:MAG TPA: menaquinol-cytochrome c reductase cytochrome b subunit [Actinomycetota bacterium]|nr:menaquinol-cytochrome c reductase cytochrome b subunit [Actinomycetota bacterium]